MTPRHITRIVPARTFQHYKRHSMRRLFLDCGHIKTERVWAKITRAVGGTVHCEQCRRDAL